MAGDEGINGVVIEKCVDAKLINSIITHQKIYQHVVDDFAPPPEEFDCSNIVGSEGVLFLTPIQEKVLGVFMVHSHTKVLWEVHTCLLPETENKLECAKALIKWVFENTTCRKLISWAPEGNQRAYDFAIKAGLVDEGVCKKSFIKNGVLLDQHLMGIGKE
jgi:hypothetical protein